MQMALETVQADPEAAEELEVESVAASRCSSKDRISGINSE
jgi:hypothetical protein